jgi:long-chain fatty acid transport protein
MAWGFSPRPASGTNYSASNPGGNPFLSATPPNGLGVGPIYSSYQVMQIVPALVWHVDDHWAVSAGPTLDIGRLQVDPGFVVPANGPLNWPQATHTTAAWGAGYQASVFYQSDEWNFGASYKSQQFFQPYQIDTTTATGAPERSSFTVNLPAITSVGAAYKGIDRWMLSTDVRYLDYQDASGFGPSGYGPAGNVLGVGFRNIFAVATGAQYQLTDAIALRAGYSWNQNPIPSSQVTANVATPLIIQHMVSFGATMQLNRSLSLSAAYSHGFQNSISGPLVAPGVGAIPGTSLTSSANVDMFMFGATVLFGG